MTRTSAQRPAANAGLTAQAARDAALTAQAAAETARDEAHTIRVFTTRPDTVFGATFMVLAPEHALVDALTTEDRREEVDAYRSQAASKTELERLEDDKEKTGVFTGGYATNPVNGEQIPVWIADYVLMGYGTGAIMAVPGHDTRDFEFAKTFDLPVRIVVDPPDAWFEELRTAGGVADEPVEALRVGTEIRARVTGHTGRVEVTSGGQRLLL